MKIAIIGYGRMGKFIEQISLQRNHEVPILFEKKNINDPRIERELTVESLKKADGFIEFGLPEGISDRLSVYEKAGIPGVIGTTGWDFNDAKNTGSWKSNKQKAALLCGSNFSVGANILFAAGKKLTEIVGRFQEYDVMIHEYHHNKKKDSPSGTAITLAEEVLSVHPIKNRIVGDALQRKIKPNELHVSSTRGGYIPGTHKLSFDSPFDTIHLEHVARTREGFALGAVLALEWIEHKQGFYTAQDFFKTLL